MKNRISLLSVLLLMVFYFIGCSSSPKKVQYNFAENENANGTAVIIFNNSSEFRLVDIDGVPVPNAEKGTVWNSIQVPAGRALNIRMYIFHGTAYDLGDQPGYRRRGVFRCPPLEVGKTYKLWYIKTYTRGANSPHYYGVGKIVLTYDNVSTSEKSSNYYRNEKNQIYAQEIPPLAGTAE